MVFLAFAAHSSKPWTARVIAAASALKPGLLTGHLLSLDCLLVTANARNGEASSKRHNYQVG